MLRLISLYATAVAASLVVAGCSSPTENSTAELDALEDVATDVTTDLSDLEPDRPAERDAAVIDTEPDVATDALTPDVARDSVVPDMDAQVESDSSGSDPLGWDLGAAGPFQVGYRKYTLEYDRPDIAGSRTISVSVWYPTEDTSGRSPAYLDVFLDAIPFEDATPADPVFADGYPVHVHSHGFQGYSGTSAFLMRHYASHGWVTIAPDHLGNTLLDHVDPLDNAHYFLKSLDISESLDLLAELPEADPLSGNVHVERVLMSGHSFGTYACWSVGGATYDEAVVRAECEDLSSGPCSAEELEVFLSGDLHDDRIVAIAPLAGTYRASWFGETGYETVEIPILAMTGSEDNPDSSSAQWARIGADTDSRWIDLDGGCHQTFALGGCPTLPIGEGFEIVNTYVLAFGRHHVLGDAGAATTGVLDGSIEVSPRVTMQGGER